MHPYRALRVPNPLYGASCSTLMVPLQYPYTILVVSFFLNCILIAPLTRIPCPGPFKGALEILGPRLRKAMERGTPSLNAFLGSLEVQDTTWACGFWGLLMIIIVLYKLSTRRPSSNY